MSGGEPQIRVYVSSASGNSKITAQQNQIELVLMAKKVDFVKIDIAACTENKEEMRRIMGDESGLAPQICNGETYCGNFETFSEANEIGTLEEFLKLPPKQQVES